MQRKIIFFNNTEVKFWKNELKEFKLLEKHYKDNPEYVSGYINAKKTFFAQFLATRSQQTQDLLSNNKFVKKLLFITPNSTKKIKIENGDLKELIKILLTENFLVQIEVLNTLKTAYDPYTGIEHSFIPVKQIELLEELRNPSKSHIVDLPEILKLTDEQYRFLKLGYLIHDLGKIMVPRYIINSNKSLTDKEFEVIKNHIYNGQKIAQEFKQINSVIHNDIILNHHEKIDGKGYRGISGDQLSDITKIAILIDSFDAMASNRTYDPSKTRQEIKIILKEQAGKQFDQKLVYFLLNNNEIFDSLYRISAGEDHD